MKTVELKRGTTYGSSVQRYRAATYGDKTIQQLSSALSNMTKSRLITSLRTIRSLCAPVQTQTTMAVLAYLLSDWNVPWPHRMLPPVESRRICAVRSIKVRTRRWTSTSVNVDVFSTLTACCDPDLWPPESNQGLVNTHCRFHQDCSCYSRDIMVTRPVWTKWMNAADKEPENTMPSPILLGGQSIKMGQTDGEMPDR